MSNVIGGAFHPGTVQMLVGPMKLTIWERLSVSKWEFGRADAGYTTRDETAKALHDEGERKLLYVASTRARDLLVLTGHGERSPFV